MAINTTGTINTGTGSVATKPAAFYDKTLLLTLRQRQFDHTKFAQQKPMPRKAGDTINFRRLGLLEVATTPLTEGVTPDGKSATVTAISATTKQYGDYMEFSDVVDFQQIDDIIAGYTVEQGHQAAESLDEIVRDELAGGSNVFYANGRTSRATVVAGDIPTVKDFRKIGLSMKKNHVKPINGKYVALVSPEVVFDLLDDPDFKKAYEIGQNNKPFIDGEIADIYGFKFVEVLNAKTFGSVHASIVLGQQAYGITKISGEGDVKSIVKALGSSGSLDPLNQRQTIGWKVNAFVAKRLQELAITRYESVPTNA